ncbi:MAG: TIGR03620 family F420-dependent LLM class oxidoreductase [Rubrobacter sp.]
MADSRFEQSVDDRLGGPVGLWTSSLDSFAAPELGEAVAELEELGYPALWYGEAFGREAFATAGLILSGTQSLRAGAGIANIYVRDATAAKAAANALGEAYPGRFVLGLGVSHRPLLEMRGLGSADGSPLKDMRGFLDALDEAPYSGPSPAAAPPRLLAALGPKMLELSRDRSDGAHPYLVTPRHTAGAREILGEGPLLVVEQGAVLADDRQQAHDLARQHLEIYLTLPNYRNSWLREGFTEEDFANGGSDKLVEELVAWGGEEEILGRVRDHLQAGADQVLVQVLSEDASSLRRDWRRLAPALLKG